MGFMKSFEEELEKVAWGFPSLAKFVRASATKSVPSGVVERSAAISKTPLFPPRPYSTKVIKPTAPRYVHPLSASEPMPTQKTVANARNPLDKYQTQVKNPDAHKLPVEVQQ